MSESVLIRASEIRRLRAENARLRAQVEAVEALCTELEKDPWELWFPRALRAALAGDDQ